MPPPENLVLIRYMARQFVVPIYPDFQGRSWYLGSDRNMVFSINYQHLYGLKREWDFHLNLESADNKSFSVIHCDNSVALSALGLAWGIQFSPNFSFGLTLNIWDNWPGKNQWSEKQQEKEHGIYIDIDSPDDNQKYETDYALTNHFDFNGVNLNIGFLWEISNNLKLGAVFKSPFRANLSHESHLQDIRIFKYDDYPDDIVPYSVSEQTDEKLDMPMSYGLGIAYAYAKNLRLSYQFRFGNDVGDTLLKQYEFSQDIQEHTFLMSLIYYL